MIYFFDVELGINDYVFLNLDGDEVDVSGITPSDTVYCWDNSIDQKYLDEHDISLKLVDYQKEWMKRHDTVLKKRLTKAYRCYGLKGYGGIRWHTAKGDAEALRRIYILELEGAPLIYG